MLTKRPRKKIQNSDEALNCLKSKHSRPRNHAGALHRLLRVAVLHGRFLEWEARLEIQRQRLRVSRGGACCGMWNLGNHANGYVQYV